MLLGTVAVGLVVFAALWALVAVRWGPLLTLDGQVVADGHRLALDDRWLSTTSRIVTDLGSPVAVDIVAAVAAVLALIGRSIMAAVVIAGARLGELGTVTVAKMVADRARPVFAQPLAVASGQSFPSGHAAGSAALYGVLVLLVAPVLARGPRVAAVLAGILFVLAVATSRVLLGVHYPSDVVAGLAVGTAWAAVAIVIGRHVSARSRVDDHPMG
ncbi:MAG TPA: phosphatase PAP2 family protein [Pseudonocardiaceae bacterium]|nr:phosphatase PAP2 family protein [Pseudonocardiaceae bacterium]